VGVFARPAHTFDHPHGTVSIVYLCNVVGGSLRPLAHEVHEVVYRHIDDVDDWHHNHERLARAALEAYWRCRAGLG
jgi:hypothetical protein